MGGLLSSEPIPTPRQTPTRNYSYDHENQRTPIRQTVSSTNTRVTPRNFEYDIFRLQRDLESLSIHGAGTRQLQSRQVTPPVRSVRNNLIKSDPYFNSSIVTYIQLEPYDSEYVQVMRKITNKKRFKVDSIEKIENPYLQRAYELKKEQKQREYPGLEEKLLFHGTTRANFDIICKFNFDWRLCKAHKYGKGVSFSPNANYASNYSDKNLHGKVMIVAKVLVGRSCIGNQFMILPPSGFDTSQKGSDGIVTVKYEDNEYLPVYKINYHIVEQNDRVRRNSDRRGGFVTQFYLDYSDDLFDFYDY